MSPSLRHQIQEFLCMRGTPPRLAHGGPAEAPRGVVEPQPPPAEVRAASSPRHRRETRRQGTRRETQHHQEQRPHIQDQTKQWTKQQQVPAPSCRAVVSMAEGHADPTVEG